MKTSKEILNHILSPYQDKLSKIRCLRKIIALLPKKYNKYITSYKLKGEILFITVSHQAIKQELFYNKHLVFSIIKTFHQAGMCKEINPKKIVTDYKYTPKQKPPTSYKFYIKPAGEFIIKATDSQIKKRFEEIKSLLKRN